MPVSQSLRDIVKVRREALSMTQERFASEMDMSQEWVSKIESGEIGTPRHKTLQRMSVVLKVPVSDLYIAAELARTKAEADRITSQVPADVEDEPLIQAAIEGAAVLPFETRRSVATKTVGLGDFIFVKISKER